MTDGDPHYHGHRQRLRERFQKSGLAGLADYEAVELLLTLAIPRSDVKQPAKALMARFGSLRGILDAPVEELRAVPGVGNVTPVALQIIKATATLYLQQSGEGHDALADPARLADFWRMRIGALRIEVFEVAYLDSGLRLLPDGVETLEEGTTDRAAVYPRRVVEAALKRRAAALVFAHNHPNGSIVPSENDKVLTRAIVLAAETVRLRVVDHLIVSEQEIFSFHKAGTAMTIAPAILHHYPGLNDAQRAIIGHLDGPLLVIAGPGSGKTYSIVLRALNLLLLEKAQPRQLVLCTFTEKAAFEMRDRLAAAARKVGYAVDLSDLTASTIHSFCNRVLTQHRHRTALGHSYDTLDDLTQLLFIFEHFDQIIGPPENDLFLLRWKTRWTAIEGVRGYFDKITEEVVDPEQITRSGDPFLSAIGHACHRYEQALLDANQTDFAHLQRFVYDLLSDPGTADAVTRDVRYVLVDEYQDTNYIQEQLLLRLTERSHNLCVVGDEDQSLYRFRGATVRNILEFKQRMPGCATVKLTTNYRSHRAIVERYDRWMASADWSNARGTPFRYDKTIEADAAGAHPHYPSVIAIWGRDRRDEVARFADLVEFLKRNEVITDYGQVALLLHSVREEHSGPYLAALEAKGIPAFCPRARAYFAIPEVRDLVGCFAVLFGWHGDGRGHAGGAVAELATYVDDAIVHLGRRFGAPHSLADALHGRLDALCEPGIRQLFDRTFRFLCLSDVRPIGDAAREEAFEQVMNYYEQNQDEMRRVIQTEVDVSLEKDGCILVGKVDLLLGGDGKLGLLDFKTSPRPKDSPELIAAYERQLCTYAHILENRYNRSVDRLVLYWTSEPRKADAMMVLPYDPKQAEAAGRHFDETVRRIQASDFAVTIPPEASICRECDLRMLCTTEGVFAKQERPV